VLQGARPEQPADEASGRARDRRPKPAEAARVALTVLAALQAEELSVLDRRT